MKIDHTPYIVDFRSAVWLPYDHRSVANTDTCFEPNIWVARVFPPLHGAQEWTASALDNWQLRYSATKLEDAIISSAPCVDEFASSDTMLRLSYDNIMVLRVNRPSTRH